MGDKVTVVRIRYDGYDPDLDEILETALAPEGFELSDLGFDLEAEERDLVFRRGKGE